MHRTRRLNDVHFLIRQPVLGIALLEFLCQNPRVSLHALYMLAALEIPALHNLRQDIRDLLIALLQHLCLSADHLVLVLQRHCLGRHPLLEIVPVCKQIDHIPHASKDQLVVKRLFDEIRHTVVKAPALNIHRRLPADHQHRYLLEISSPFHDLHHFKSIHDRHDQIQQHHADLTLMPREQIDPLLSVICRDDRILPLKYLCQHLAVKRHIIDNQYLVSHVLSSCRS